MLLEKCWIWNWQRITDKIENFIQETNSSPVPVNKKIKKREKNIIVKGQSWGGEKTKILAVKYKPWKYTEC